MIRQNTLLLSSIALVLAFGSTPLHAEKKAPPKPITITEVVAKVSNSLATACKTSDCAALTGVDLTLHTEVDKDGHVGVSIFGISLGGHREQDSYNEFSLHLAPPDHNAPPLSSMQSVNVSEALVNALKAFADASVAAKKGDYPLVAGGFYLELSFTVQYGVSGDTSGLSLIPIYPDVSGKIDKKNVQTVRLTFGKTS
jgi:hypothetical protein